MSISVVQSTGNSGFGSGDQSKAFASNNAAGNVLVAFAWINGLVGTPTMTDTVGNVWNLVLTELTNGGVTHLHCFVAFNSRVGANTVTVHYSGTAANLFCIAEISGVNSQDQLAGNTEVSGPTVATPNITNSNANEIIIAAIQSAGTATPTIGSGYVLLGSGVSASSFGIAEYQIVSSIGTYNATFGGAASNNGTIIVSFQQLLGGVGGWVNTPHDFVNKRGVEW